VTTLLGGTFNPPHNGHVELVRAAEDRFGDEVVVLVVARPGHKEVQLDADTRLELARAAFPDHEVELESHERTVDMLKAGRWRDPLFLIGADQFSDFMSWKDPEGVIARARLGVATRPGFPGERLETVLRQLSHPERIEFFEIVPLPISSEDLRERVSRGESIDGLVPEAVAELIEERGLYREGGSYTSAAF
jgi:nicotinate-nucleotide adenylyltransferase